MYGCLLASFILGIGCRTRSTDPNAGFSVNFRVASRGVMYPFPVLASVTGSLISPSPPTTGNRTFFNEFFTQNETKRIAFAVVPGLWGFSVGGVPGVCLPQRQFMRLDDRLNIVCSLPNFAELVASPSHIDATSPGETLILHGKAISSQLQAPRATWYNELGQVVATSQVLNYSAQNGSLTLQMPNLTGWRNGNYLILVHSTETPTESNVLGAAIIAVFGNDDPPPPIEPNPCLQPQLPCVY